MCRGGPLGAPAQRSCSLKCSVGTGHLRGNQGPIRGPGPHVIYAWGDPGSPQVTFCIFKGEQTKMVGPMEETHVMACLEAYILSDTLL